MKSGGVKKNLINVIIVLMIIGVVFLNSYSYMQKKNGFFLDETCSFLFSNVYCTSASRILEGIRTSDLSDVVADFDDMRFPVERWETHEEVIERYTTGASGKFNYLNMYIILSQDVHPPLYYFFLNTFSSFFPNLSIKWTGYLINIFFLLFTCVLIFKIILLVLGEDKSLIACSAALFYGLSFEFVNNATYFRMYAMLAFWLTLLLYMSISWCLRGYGNESHEIVKHCLVVFMAMLTQYFAAFFVFPIVVLNVVYMLRRSTSPRKYIRNLIASGVIYIVVWPFSISQVLFSNRGQDVAGNIGLVGLLYRLKSYLWWLCMSLFAGSKKLIAGVMTLMILWIAVSACKLIRRAEDGGLKEYEKYFYIAIPAAVYYIVVAALSPWVVDRYQMPVMPMISMLIVLTLWKTAKLVIKNPNACGAVLIAFSVLCCIHWKKRLEPYYLYNDSARIDYISQYSGVNAMLVDPEGTSYKSEIEMNYAHPMYFSTMEDNFKVTLNQALSDNDNLIVYACKTCDQNKIRSGLEAANSLWKKLDYSDDSYDVYYLYSE